MSSRVFDFSDHACRSMRKRGAAEFEVVDTIQSGRDHPARHPKLGRAKVFRDGYEHEVRQYPHKELWVYYVEEREVTTVVTVIVRYGYWESEK